MERHLLITVGDDLSSLYGVRFVGFFFNNKAEIKLTLLYVAPRFDAMDAKEDVRRHKMDPRLAEAFSEKGKAALEASRTLLLHHGFPESGITTKLIEKRYGTVRDIVHEGRAGLYDAVVLGRRGYAVFERALSTSVSREIMDQRVDFPFWICRRIEEGRKDVLLCVDDSQPSLHIADHVGFILDHEPNHAVTLFHVDSGEGQNVEKLMDEAKARLLENHVAQERIKTVVVRSRDVVGAVMKEAAKGNYAAVAVGRGGTRPKGVFRNWYIGSRSMKLLESLEKAALWVSK